MFWFTINNFRKVLVGINIVLFINISIFFRTWVFLLCSLIVCHERLHCTFFKKDQSIKKRQLWIYQIIFKLDEFFTVCNKYRKNSQSNIPKTLLKKDFQQTKIKKTLSLFRAISNKTTWFFNRLGNGLQKREFPKEFYAHTHTQSKKAFVPKLFIQYFQNHRESRAVQLDKIFFHLNLS